MNQPSFHTLVVNGKHLGGNYPRLGPIWRDSADGARLFDLNDPTEAHEAEGLCEQYHARMYPTGPLDEPERGAASV